jgi:hypothetical protein
MILYARRGGKDIELLPWCPGAPACAAMWAFALL